MKLTEDFQTTSTTPSSKPAGFKFDRETAYVQDFLVSLGVQDRISRRISPNLTVTEISGPNTRWLNAKDRRVILLKWSEGSTSIPISVFFLSQSEKQNFGHASLLTESAKKNSSLLGKIADATQNLFSGKPKDLLGSLCPQWINEDFAGMIDKRMLWALPESPIVTTLLDKTSKATLELPVLPSVFAFNNPYLGELLEVTDPDVTKDTKILSMGCGAGLEMAYFAMKHKIVVHGVDINPIAVLNSKMIADDLGVENLVKAWTSDGFNQVDEAYDLIFSNAPLAMTERREPDPNRFDPQGEFMKKMLGELSRFLRPGGRLVVMSHRNLTPYLPDQFDFRILKNFEVKIPLAISEVFLRP